MRNLSNETNKSTLTNIKKIEEVEESLDVLTNKVEQNKTDISEIKTKLIGNANTFRTDNLHSKIVTSDSVNTGDITAISAYSEGLSGNNITGTNIRAVERITSDRDISTQTLIVNENANISSIKSGNAEIDSITANDAFIGNLEVGQYEAESQHIGTLTVDNVEVHESLGAETVNASNLNVMDSLDVKGTTELKDTKVSGNLDADNIKVNELKVDTAIETSSIHFSDHFVFVEDPISDTSINVIELPKVTNGNYRVVFTDATDESNVRFVFDIHNTNGDIDFTYTREDDAHSLSAVAIKDNKVYLQTNKGGNLYYHSDSLEYNLAPATYSEWPIDISTLDFPLYECSRKHATVYTNYSIDNMSDIPIGSAGLSLRVTNDWSKDVENEVEYNPNLEAVSIRYRPDQSVNTDAKVTFDEVTVNKIKTGDIQLSGGNVDEVLIQGNEKVTFRQLKNDGDAPKSDSNKILTEKDLAAFDGTSDTDTYNIIHLGKVVDGEWNAGDITTGNADIGELSVDNIEASGDVHIAGDLTVDGITTTVHTEEVTTKSNTITLRDGATTAIQPGEVSGLEIENYDGNGTTLQLAVDSEGTLRIGTDIGTSGGDNEPILTRSESEDLVDGNILVWNAEQNKAVDSGDNVDGLLHKNDDEINDEQGWTSQKIVSFVNQSISVPVGMILMYPSDTLPEGSGYLFCNGGVYNRADYPELYDFLPDTYHISDTQFATPNFSNRVPQGSGDNAVNSLVDAGLPNITGKIECTSSSADVQFLTDTGSYTSGGALFVKSTRSVNSMANTSNMGSHPKDISFDASRANSIYGNSSTVQPPAIIQNFIIKATSTAELGKSAIDDEKTTRYNTWSAEKLNPVMNAEMVDNVEYDTGKTFNGKKVYRQTFTVDTYSGTGAQLVIASLKSAKEILYQTCLKSTTGSLFHWAGGLIRFYIQPGSGVVYLYKDISTEWSQITDMHFYIEYTK